MRHSTTDSTAHTVTRVLAFLSAIFVSKLLQRRYKLMSGSTGDSGGSLREQAAMHQYSRDLIRRSILSS